MTTTEASGLGLGPPRPPPPGKGYIRPIARYASIAGYAENTVKAAVFNHNGLNLLENIFE